MADFQLIKEFAEVLKQKDRSTQPYDTTAEVTRIDDDGTAWVHIPGGTDETPVQMSINAREGDTVRVRVAGGQAWTVGNDTAPPTDDKKANEAQATADEALLKVHTIEASAIYTDYLETGGISADYIKAGTISDETGRTSWDLNNGELHLANNVVGTVDLDVIVSGSPDGDLGPGLRVEYTPAGDTYKFWGPSLTMSKTNPPDWIFQGRYGDIYNNGHLYLSENNKRLIARNTSMIPTYVPLIYLNDNNNIIVGAASNFNNMNFFVPSGQAFNFNGNIRLPAGATVDGVDVSELTPVKSKSVSGTTSSTGGINTGLATASNIILCVKNNGTATYDCTVRSNGNTTNYYVAVRDGTNALVANTAVDLTVYYMEI